MIFYDTIYPEKMAGVLMDQFLDSAWYRLGPGFITTDLITQEGRLVPVFWLRINMRQYLPTRSARRILARNAQFQTSIHPFYISAELEDLYARYRVSIRHSISPGISEYLFDGAPYNPFDTRVIEVRDAGTLIAAGYFDLGQASSAGILHIYDPTRQRESLGKYLLLAELEYAKQCGHEYYYPGYLSPEVAKFDYKLFASPTATEIFVRPLKRWYPYPVMQPKIARWGALISRAAANYSVA
jgi:leucyl-tRNA---protein transferase